MAIDIDKIEKLIRLANNNPNDNEANLAARKACKMLKDYKFTSVPETKIYTPKPPSPTPHPNPSEPWAGFWEDVRKQAAKEKTNQHYKNYGGSYHTPRDTNRNCKNCGAPFLSYMNDLCPRCQAEAKAKQAGDMKDKWTDPRTGTVPPRSDEGYTARKRCRVCNSIYEGNECPTCREMYKTFTGRYSSRTPEKKTRQCVKCGHHKETMRVTTIFTCNECEWKEWQEKQDETGKNS